MAKSTYKHYRVLPYLLLAPQLLVTIIFFIWPTAQSIQDSFIRGDAFGIHHHFAGLYHYTHLFQDPDYLEAIGVTVLFSLAVTAVTCVGGLLMAALVNHVNKGKRFFKTFYLLPYAIAPAVAGIIWRFLFNPSVGVVSNWLDKIGVNWNYYLHPWQALLLVILASSWQQISYNFLFYFAGLQAIPKSLLESAALDGAGPVRRFFNIELPLLSPTTFFLIVMNLIYAFFETFGVIQVVTHGGPDNRTNILVYKVYHDGMLSLNVGSAAAQSILLMGFVILLTYIQFRYIERRVHYT